MRWAVALVVALLWATVQDAQAVTCGPGAAPWFGYVSGSYIRGNVAFGQTAAEACTRVAQVRAISRSVATGTTVTVVSATVGGSGGSQCLMRTSDAPATQVSYQLNQEINSCDAMPSTTVTNTVTVPETQLTCSGSCTVTHVIDSNTVTPFAFSVSDGVTLSFLIIGVWASALAIRAFIRSVQSNQDA